jgi:hypothetical protein
VFYNAETIPVSLAVGDLEGDLRVLINNGAACLTSFLTFTKMWPATTDGTWPGFPSMVDFAISDLMPTDVAVADLNRDGKNDLIVLNQFTETSSRVSKPGAGLCRTSSDKCA